MLLTLFLLSPVVCTVSLSLLSLPVPILQVSSDSRAIGSGSSNTTQQLLLLFLTIGAAIIDAVMIINNNY